MTFLAALVLAVAVFTFIGAAVVYEFATIQFRAAKATLREAVEAQQAATDAYEKAQTYFAAALKLEDEAAQLAGAKIIDRARESSR